MLWHRWSFHFIQFVAGYALYQCVNASAGLRYVWSSSIVDQFLPTVILKCHTTTHMACSVCCQSRWRKKKRWLFVQTCAAIIFNRFNSARKIRFFFFCSRTKCRQFVLWIKRTCVCVCGRALELSRGLIKIKLFFSVSPGVGVRCVCECSRALMGCILNKIAHTVGYID